MRRKRHIMTPRAQSYQAKAHQNEQEKNEVSLVRRYFTKKDTHPFDTVEWETSDVKITKPNGEVVFEQKSVEKPKFWSDRAIQIVAQKYFRVPPRLGRKESSVKELIGRVADTITEWGRKDGYFNDEEEKETFRTELTYILLHQKAAFNSPVWFNVGVEEKPQCSACFILSVEDTMPSILEWCTTEGMIFKGGSGAGINLSSLRSSREPLSKGGIASGPVSFMKGADAIAGMVKSGGGTRRAAKMVVLNIDHPDIKDFIFCKVEAEKMLHTLVAQGFDSSLEGKIFSPYTCIPYQNANNSVRVSDEFMRAVEADGYWQLRAVKTGEALEEVRAKELLDMIAEAAWQCADPGTQYDTTINAWHTCPKSGRISASNPCSEYMSLDNSACNLASLNLLRYLRADRTFDVEAYKHSAHVMFLAQEIIVGNSSYPTPKITENAKAYRQLGLGYANLGALLMVLGLPYDSDSGRAWGAVLTALMTGEAYHLSGLIAKRMGPYEGFAKNREDHIRVMKQHRAALKAETHPARYQIEGVVPDDLYQAALHAWNKAVETAQQYGHRNSQATVLAPTGTISFMMDCETTGIEPELFLIKTKDLVGGGTISIENRLVSKALQTLGYTNDEVQPIIAYLRQTGTIEGAPGLRDNDLPVFDCAIKATNGIRYLSPMAHITMMAAVQPFISGSISKTVNVPQEATKEDFFNLYFEGWRLGIKSLALYREGSKAMTIYRSSGEKKKDLPVEALAKEGEPTQEPFHEEEAQAKHETTSKVHVLGDEHDEMEKEHRAIVKPFKVATTKGRLIVGVDSTGHAKEIYLEAAKVGSAVAGYLKSIGISISKGLRAGVPLKVYVDALSGVSFEPSGFTDDPEEPVASSVISYCMRWMAKRFPLNGESAEYDWGNIGTFEKMEEKEDLIPAPEMLAKESQQFLEATQQEIKTDEIRATLASSWNREYTFFCSDCGNFMKPTGTNCFTCTTCGTNTGCG